MYRGAPMRARWGWSYVLWRIVAAVCVVVVLHFVRNAMRGL